jgi:Asp-tRNA(Asn)/Glu-tRNA(Gln) amidotransferase C subunit
MLDHIHLMDKRLEAMAAALERQGITDHFSRLPDLDVREIDSTADDGESDRDSRPPESTPGS